MLCLRFLKYCGKKELIDLGIRVARLLYLEGRRMQKGEGS